MSAKTNSIKIAHITTVHPALDARIFFRECRSLAQEGYEVLLIAPGSDDLVDNIQIKGISYAKNRFARVFKLQWRALRLALKEKAMVYHIHDPELIVFGIILRIFNKKVVYDAHEDLANSIKYKKYLSSSAKKFWYGIAVILTKCVGIFYQKVVAATPDIAKQFPEKKTAIIKNFPPINNFPILEKEKFNLNASCTYIGRISKDRGIHEMLQSISEVAKITKCNLQLAGSMDPPNLANELKTHSGWIYSQYHGICGWEQIASVLQNSQMGLLLLHPQETYVVSYPLKLFEYMAAGIPVIASDFPLWREIISAANCGLLVDPLNITAITQHINYLLANPDIAYQMGQNGRLAVEQKYNWEKEFQGLLELYKEIISKPPPLEKGD